MWPAREMAGPALQHTGARAIAGSVTARVTLTILYGAMIQELLAERAARIPSRRVKALAADSAEVIRAASAAAVSVEDRARAVALAVAVTAAALADIVKWILMF